MSARSAKTTATERGVANGAANGSFPAGPGLGVAEAADASRMFVDALKLAMCAGSGVVFGMAAEKGKVFIPAVIQNQMTFSQFTMIKMFLSAVAAGLGSFIILNLLPTTHNLFSNMRDSFGCCVRNKRITAFVVGGVLLGVGMTLSGSCPGMVLVQVGAGTQNALYTMAGCFTGALLYGAMEPTLSRVLFHKHTKSPNNAWVDKLLGLPYTYVAVPLAIILGGITLVIEYLVPWTTEVPVSPAAVGVLEQKSWSPVLAGLLMGSLQLSVVLSVGDSLGGSSSYCTVLSHTGGRALSYFKSFRSGIGNWWQVIFWLGGIAGAALSAHLSGTWGTSAGVTPLLGFLGGGSMLLGARIASGCTSGHGLSGMSLLSTSSFVAVPAMFAGAMGLAFALRT